MIPSFLQPYSKLVVAILGVGALVAFNRFGVQNSDLDSFTIGLVRDSVIGALTSFGVYQVTNAPKE